jgi:hypothetical protein
MKVRIIRPIPVEQRHGIAVGGVYEVVAELEGTPRLYSASLFIMGAAGEEVGLLSDEYERIDERTELHK